MLDVAVSDDTGELTLAFFGRTRLAGVGVGRRLRAGGALVRREGRLVMLNPYYWLTALSTTTA